MDGGNIVLRMILAPAGFAGWPQHEALDESGRVISPTDPVSMVLKEPSVVLTWAFTRSSGTKRSISSSRMRSRRVSALKKNLVRCWLGPTRETTRQRDDSRSRLVEGLAVAGRCLDIGAECLRECGNSIRYLTLRGERVVTQHGPVALLKPRTAEPLFPPSLEVSAVTERKDFKTNVCVHCFQRPRLFPPDGQAGFVRLNEQQSRIAHLSLDFVQLIVLAPERSELSFELGSSLKQFLMLDEVDAPLGHLLPQRLVRGTGFVVFHLPLLGPLSCNRSLQCSQRFGWRVSTDGAAAVYWGV